MKDGETLMDETNNIVLDLSFLSCQGQDFLSPNIFKFVQNEIFWFSRLKLSKTD